MDNSILGITLDLAVPLWIERFKERPWSELKERADACQEVIAHQADQVLFKTKAGKDQVGTAEAFNRLAEALAILSFVPGGVKFLGRHWETVDAETQTG